MAVQEHFPSNQIELEEISQEIAQRLVCKVLSPKTYPKLFTSCICCQEHFYKKSLNIYVQGQISDGFFYLQKKV